MSHDTPAGFVPPIAVKLFKLAKQLEDFAASQEDCIAFARDYLALCAYGTKLLAYANLLSAFNRESFLEAEIAEVEGFLASLKQRLGKQEE